MHLLLNRFTGIPVQIEVSMGIITISSLSEVTMVRIRLIFHSHFILAELQIAYMTDNGHFFLRSLIQIRLYWRFIVYIHVFPLGLYF